MSCNLGARSIMVLVLAGLLCFGVSGTTFAASKPVRTLKFGHEHTTIGAPHECCIKFVEMAEKLTDAELKVNVFPAGALGKERQMFEAAQAGTLDIMYGGAVLLATFCPGTGMDFFALPGTQPDLEYFVRSTRTDGPFARRVDEILQTKGFKLLSFGGPHIFKLLTNKKPIYTLDDIENLKCRVPEVPAMLAGMKALRAKPVAIPFGEVYTALQLGTVDCVPMSEQNIITMKFYEVGKYLSLYSLFPITHSLLVSLKVWNGLDAKYQNAIQAAGEEWRRVFNEGYVNLESSGLRWLAVEGGLTINGVKNRKAWDALIEEANRKYMEQEPGVRELYELSKKSAEK